MEKTLIHPIILLDNFQRDLTCHMIWLWMWRENFWAPEVLDWKTSLTEFRCLDSGLRHMVWFFGMMQCRARVGLDDPRGSLPFDSVIRAITVERKYQAWWNYCSLSTVMKLLTLITLYCAFMDICRSKHMFSYGYLGQGGLMYAPWFGLVYSRNSSSVSTVRKMVWTRNQPYKC